ncbi:MAG: hemerythrin domain-containing protein [Rhodoferax sp.]
MQHISIRIINEEHASLSSVLQSIRMMIKRGPQNSPEAFFDVMRAMLFYIDEIPEKQHHIKESTLLFPPVAARSAQCAAVIEKLEKDHETGEPAVRELQHLLVSWEMLGESRRKEFEKETLNYIDFYTDHMHREETLIIPEALKLLTNEDWERLDSAFQSNTDPLSERIQRIPVYDRLFTKIVMRAPAPIGLGHS